MGKRSVVAGLPGPVVGWVHNHAVKNYWRVAAHCEVDDLVQDGLLCACRCLAKYGTPGVDIDHPHFMALVKTAFYNHIGTLMRQYRGVDDATKLSDMRTDADASAAADAITGGTETDFDLVRVVAEMPERLRRVVVLYLNAPERLRRPMRARLSGDETMAERLRKLAGFPEDGDFEGELRSYLWCSRRGIRGQAV